MDDVHDILKKYSYYQDDNSLFKFKLNDTFILNNKVDFLKHIDTKLTKYLNDKKDDPDFIEEKDTCDIASKQTGFTPFLHQDLVKEYLNATSPYRGLLLYHGLGSGKTCTSIGIIEAMKQTKSKIFILTPASLAKNYKTQMKSCGSLLFRKDENWEYVSYPTDDSREQFINDVHKLTQLDMKYLNSKKGIYLRTKGVVNNTDELSNIQKEELDEQINKMIDARFNFISYNGINMKSWNTKYKNPRFGKHYNPFNNSTIIIDEGHNFVSRIINKLNINQSSVSTELYNHIIQAENCNVVVLSGTPLINYPSELGVMFNLISGCYTTFEFRCNHSNPKMLNLKEFHKVLKDLNLIDHVKYISKTNTLQIIKNPYGFVSTNDNMLKYDFKQGKVSNKKFYNTIKNLLQENKYQILKSTTNPIIYHKKFPDTHIEFNKFFISNNGLTLRNKQYFQNKIVGLVSYLGDKKELMPQIIVPQQRNVGSIYYDEEIFIEEIEMNDNVLKSYKLARETETNMDKNLREKKRY